LSHLTQALPQLRSHPRWWRFALLGVVFLPVLFSAGGCPDLSHAAEQGGFTLAWFCSLITF
jgi:hypothetical protein